MATSERFSKHQKVAIRLNERSIRAIEPPASGYRLTADSDLRGFGIRVTAAGVRSFVLTYTIDGRQRRYTVGEFPVLNATAARKKAEDLKRGIRDGIDPLAEKEHRREAMTFGELAELYLDRHASKKRSGHEDRRQIERDVLPKWKHRKAEDLKRRDVIELIDGKAETAPIAANRLLACVRKVFNWAVSKDLLAASPCVQIEAPGEETERDRVLSAAEIRHLWETLDAPEPEQPPEAPRRGKAGDESKRVPRLEMTPEARAALKLILVTAQRPGEVCSMEWADIDKATGWWTIPAAKAKNGLAHRVPLTNLALELLRGEVERRIEANGAGAGNAERWVFPSPRGDQPIHRNALAYGLRRNRDFLGMDPWTPHDLRRTASTFMGSLGVQQQTIDRVLNHLEPKLTRTYQRHTFDPEKKTALEKWARKLREILEGRPAKVVSIG